MATQLALAVAVAALPQSSASVLRGQSVLGNGMQPEVVARTLSSVQDEWKAQAGVFASCGSASGLPGASIVNCQDAPTSFGKSCGTVVNAIIQGSGGDKDVAKEYMSDVCSQKSISGWHQTQCNSLAAVVRGSMSADKYLNREAFDSKKLCTGVWASLVDVEKKRIDQEKADREAAEKKAAEEDAAEEKRVKEAAAKEAEHKKIEEAKLAKEEAKRKAEEAAARLAEKKAEAEAVKEAAAKKMEEAKAAEQEQAKAKKDAASKAKAAEAKAQAAAKKPEAPAPVAAKAAPAKVEAAKAAAPAAKAAEAAKIQPAKAPAATPAKPGKAAPKK